ncbi:polymer-forming cytoskeletal protein [Halovenus rubra]|uniref:Polymer-forming cytoskeletal protein n=2 Tax=Halovenus rubra TaxID=869890 RepID=A0ACC7E2K1_9EURY
MSSFRSDPLDELIIPDGTHVQEHDLVTEGDVIVGGQSTIAFGVRGGNVIAGERVEFGGHIEAEGDCRLDMWCDITDNVLVGEDAYLGERVHIEGELRVAGNLDIGDDVDIEDGFDASGWIVIRNPMPTIVFLFMYLSQLLRIGEEEKAEELLSAVVDEDQAHDPVVIPRGSYVSDDAWRVSTPGRVGSDCRLHGNIRAQSLIVGRDNEIFGSLRAKDGITVGSGTEVTGNVTTRSGTVRIGPETDVRGDISGEYVEVHRDAEVEGAIRAREEMTIVSEPVLDDSVVEGDAETANGGTGVEQDEATPSTAASDDNAVSTPPTEDEPAATATPADDSSKSGGDSVSDSNETVTDEKTEDGHSEPTADARTDGERTENGAGPNSRPYYPRRAEVDDR